MRMRMNAVVSMVASLCLAATMARGQEVLFSNSREFASFPIGQALSDLGIAHTFVQTNQQTLDALRSQPWDLVIMRRMERFAPEFEADILAELEAHVETGGKLHFQMADLENVPQGWYDLLGLEGAVDLELPLSEIVFAPPKHPSVPGGGFLPLVNDPFPPDYGDALLPAPGSTVTEHYFVGERPSTVLSHAGRVLVNGQQWDNWWPIESSFTAAGQIRWLLRCPADLDLDGSLTINDFLVFQNLFDLKDTVADIDGDGAWTVFDFLEFLNRFEAGCP